MVGICGQRSCLVSRWEAFERRWLQERESHAVVALQPLVSAVRAAEAVLKSSKQQIVLPEPSASKQQMCTYRALQAFCNSITAVARDLLPVESSCLFLEAATLVFAAAIAEAADRAATERALERRSPQLASTGSPAPKSVRPCLYRTRCRFVSYLLVASARVAIWSPHLFLTLLSGSPHSPALL